MDFTCTCKNISCVFATWCFFCPFGSSEGATGHFVSFLLIYLTGYQTASHPTTITVKKIATMSQG